MNLIQEKEIENTITSREEIVFKNLYPYEYVESVFTINYEKLYEKGYRGIIFDLDNTLVPHGEPSTPKVDTLFKKIQKIGFKTFILSDNGVKRIGMENKMM